MKIYKLGVVYRTQVLSNTKQDFQRSAETSGTLRRSTHFSEKETDNLLQGPGQSANKYEVAGSYYIGSALNFMSRRCLGPYKVARWYEKRPINNQTLNIAAYLTLLRPHNSLSSLPEQLVSTARTPSTPSTKYRMNQGH